MAESILNRSLPIPDTYFGMHFGGINDRPWPSVPFKGLRLWDSWGADVDKANAYGGIAWGDIHRSAGVYHWQLFDSFMAKLTTNGQIGTYTFGWGPAWLNGSNTAPATTTQQLDAWAAFVTAIVNRAAGKIKVWGLWNEPNASNNLFYSGTPAQLATMAARAYAAIKAVDPSAIVLSPEVQGNGAGWLTDFLNAGGGAYFDVCGVHLYGYPDARLATSGGALTAISAYRSALNAAGQSAKPIWNTEFSALGIYDTSHVEFIGKAYPLFWAAGVDRSFWYQWDNENPANGQMWTSGGTNAVAVAYTQVRSWLYGATVSGQAVVSGSVWYIDLILASGLSGRIVWHAGGSSSYTIPAAKYSQSRTLAGTQAFIAASATTVQISNSPILLESLSSGTPSTMATVTFRGLNSATLMSTAFALPQGQQKAKYCQEVIAALGSNPVVELKRGETAVYRSYIPGNLTFSNNSLVVPSQFAEPPTLNVAGGLTPQSPALGNIVTVGDDFIRGSDTNLHASPMDSFRVLLSGEGYTQTFVGTALAKPGDVPVNAVPSATVATMAAEVGNVTSRAPLIVIVALGHHDMQNASTGITAYLNSIWTGINGGAGGKKVYVFAPILRSFTPQAAYQTLVNNMQAWCNASPNARFFSNWSDANLIPSDYAADGVFLNSSGASKIAFLMFNKFANTIVLNDRMTMEIRNAQNPAVALSIPIKIGGTGNFIGISKDLAGGTEAVRTSGVTFPAPLPLDANVSAPPPAGGGTTWSLAEADAAMVTAIGYNECKMQGINNGAPGWKSRDAMVMGNEWRDLDRWYNWESGETSLSESTYREHLEMWAVAGHEEDVSTVSGWIEVRNEEFQILYKGESAWTRFVPKKNTAGWGDPYIPNWNGQIATGTDMQTGTGSDGGYSIFIPHGRSPHWTGPSRYRVPGMGTIEGVMTAMEVRIAPNQPSGFKAYAHVSGDPKYSSSPGNDGQDGAYTPYAISRTMRLSTTWKRITCNNVHRPDIDVPNHPGYVRRVMSLDRWRAVRPLN